MGNQGSRKQRGGTTLAEGQVTDGGGDANAMRPSSDGSGLPVIFKWTHGGQQVQLVGSFNNWQPIQMVRSGIEFSVALDLPRGVYKYRFVVDNEQKYAQDQPVTTTETGMQNVLDTLNYKRFEPQTELDDMDLDVESLEYGMRRTACIGVRTSSGKRCGQVWAEPIHARRK